MHYGLCITHGSSADVGFVFHSYFPPCAYCQLSRPLLLLLSLRYTALCATMDRSWIEDSTWLCSCRCKFSCASTSCWSWLNKKRILHSPVGGRWNGGTIHFNSALYWNLISPELTLTDTFVQTSDLHPVVQSYYC